MPPQNRSVDKDGFPIPPTFDPVAEKTRPRGGQAVWIVRAMLIVAALVMVASVALKGVGPDYIADWYHRRAINRYQSDDLRGAIADLDRAISWTPEKELFYYQRGHFRQKAHDLSGSLDDFNRLIELNPNFYGGYTGRSTVYQRMERHREAIDDVTRAIRLRPKNDHELLNHRAYARAIANMELEEALADIQQAIELAGYEEAAYLDTRGYIYYLLGRHEEALADLDRAVQLASSTRKLMLQKTAAQHWSSGRRAHEERKYNENEAVMIYHRGLVHEKLGNHEQAAADISRGEDLGYNPAKGVY
jgi:tetratricopeptide (TPR) repeat protein